MYESQMCWWYTLGFQCMSLKYASAMCWDSHYGMLVSLITMFSSSIQVLETILDDSSTSEQRSEANNLLLSM